jgi:hypothetical protein
MRFVLKILESFQNALKPAIKNGCHQSC